MRKLLFWALLITQLLLPVVSYAGDYYVNCTMGSDSTGDGSIGNPWASDEKAFDALDSVDGAHTVHVSGAPCLTEGKGTPGFGGAKAGATITHVCDDAVRCEMRIDATDTLSNVYRHSATATGTNIWMAGANRKAFYFRQDIYGDGRANSGKKRFFTVEADATYEFYDNEILGGVDTFFLTASATANPTTKLFRNYIHGRFTGAGPLYVNGNMYLYANYIDMAVSHAFGVVAVNNGTLGTVRIVNNTFNQATLTDSGTSTITDLVIDNNIFTSDGAVRSVQLNGAITTLTSAKNNLFYNYTPPSPRTAAGYPPTILTGWVDNSYYFNPDFSTIPALNSTSLALCRGNAAYAPATGYNGVAFDPACPTIGAWYPASGTKQHITTNPKQIAFVGDSHSSGRGCTNGSNCYYDDIKKDAEFSGWSIIDMPGAANYMWAVSGILASTAHYMAQDVLQGYKPGKIVLQIGGCDVIIPTDPAIIVQRITNTMNNLVDITGKPHNAIYLGTLSGGLSVDKCRAVEAGVIANSAVTGYRAVNALHKAIKNADWAKTFYFDGIHWNPTGHLFLAEVLKPALLAGAMQEQQQERP